MRATTVLPFHVMIVWLTTTGLCAVGAEEKSVPSRGKVLYVAPGGSDTNAGTKDRPLATLEAARDAIRRLKSAGPLPTESPRC